MVVSGVAVSRRRMQGTPWIYLVNTYEMGGHSPVRLHSCTAAHGLPTLSGLPVQPGAARMVYISICNSHSSLPHCSIAPSLHPSAAPCLLTPNKLKKGNEAHPPSGHAPAGQRLGESGRIQGFLCFYRRRGYFFSLGFGSHTCRYLGSLTP